MLVTVKFANIAGPGEEVNKWNKKQKYTDLVSTGLARQVERGGKALQYRKAKRAHKAKNEATRLRYQSRVSAVEASEPKF